MTERSGTAAIGWAALAVSGQAAAVSLVKAGHAVGYQHYLPIRELPSRPLGLAIILMQLVLVGWGMSRDAATFAGASRKLLPGWRLPALLMAMAVSAATVGHDVPRWVAESALSLVVQLSSVGTVVLFARALPLAVVASLRRRFDALLGAHTEPDDRLRPRLDRFAAVTALLVTVVCALLSLVVYERHPHIQDEVAYLFQARTFASGRLALPLPPVPRSFELYLITASPVGWYSPVPPGWALALAPGVIAGAVWLVNPLLAGANVLLGYLVLQPLYGRRTARLATVLLAVSPWNLFLGMSFMPHTFTLFCALLGALGVITARRTDHARWTWLGGLALGVLAGVRQLDAMIAAAALGLWAIGFGGRRLRIGAVVGLVAGSMVAAAPLLLYNRHFTGRAGAFPIMTYTDALYGKGRNDYGFGANRGMGWALDPNPGHGPVDGAINATLNITATQVEAFGWSVGSLLLLYLFLCSSRLTRSDRLMLGLVAIDFAAYFFNYFAGGPDFGARYWFLMIVPIAALTARGAISVGSMLDVESGGTRMLAGVALLVLSASTVFVPWRSIDKYWHYRGMRADLRGMARAQGFGEGLVLVSGREVPDYASAAPYNPLDLGAHQPVYVRRLDPASDSAAVAAFGARSVWLVDGPTTSHAGYVVRAGPLSAAEALVHISTPAGVTTGGAASPPR